MPLIAVNDLPSFNRLSAEGVEVLPQSAAIDKRPKLVAGIINLMPDAALEATERQFLRLLAAGKINLECHFSTLTSIPRSCDKQRHIERHYLPLPELQSRRLDLLVITGANPSSADLTTEPYWQQLANLLQWARSNIDSTLFACLATHAAMQEYYGEQRSRLAQKCWGVYSHQCGHTGHPFLKGVVANVPIPHSRHNQITRDQFESNGLTVLMESEQVGVHLATTQDGVKQIFMQGHPEYDTVSLLKELKRDLSQAQDTLLEPPRLPDNYLPEGARTILQRYLANRTECLAKGQVPPLWPEAEILAQLHNNWSQDGRKVVANWLTMLAEAKFAHY